jgi:AraC-like DNA-binding protein
MNRPTRHDCRVIASPWPGAFGTDVDSARGYDPHWHTTFGMGLMARGAHRSLSDRGIVDAHAGDVITSNPGEVHDGRPLGTASRRWRMVYLEPSMMATMSDGAEVRLTRPVIQDAVVAVALRRLLRRLERWRPGPPAAALACEEALVLACGLMLDRHSTASSGREVRADIRRAQERLADHDAHTPSLAELAALVGVSKYQLLRRFEQVCGITPHQWLRQIRLERAWAAIRRGTRLAHAAAECGFADQSHMTRAFVAHFGFTPGRWEHASGRAAPVGRSAKTAT